MAENCIFKIKLQNGTTKEFGSQEELDSFIRDNKKELIASLLQGKTIFSKEKNEAQQTESKLRSQNLGMHLRKSDHVYYRTNSNGTTEEGFTSTTQWITKPHDLGNPSGPEYMVPEFRQDMYIQELAGELISAGISQDMVDKIIEEKKQTWELSTVAGTSLHDVAENFVLKNYTSAEAIKTDYPKLSDDQAKNYFDSLTSLINQIKAEHGDDAILIPEFIIVDNDAKLTGTIDLLVIDNKGKLHIYDYKTSFKDIADWKQVKKNTVDYQLTTYKQMLLRQGFEVGKTKYVPIKIIDYNAASDTVENFIINPLMDSTQSSRGNVVFKINLLLPHAFKPKTDFIVDNKAISEVLLKSFNYEIKNASVNRAASSNTVKQQLDYLIESGKRYPDAKDNEFVYLPPIGGASVKTRVYINDPEEKNLQIINAYLTQLQQYNENLPYKITDYVTAARQSISEGRAIDNSVLWNNDDSYTADQLSNLLGKYVNSDEWKAFESDVMSDLGIVAFENENTHQVDFITMTGKALNEAPSLLNKRRKLLGNTITDQKSKDLGYNKDITNGDIELLKIYAFIQNNEATFKDKKIGTIAAVQLNTNQSVDNIAVQTVSSLHSQWMGLTKYGDDFELKAKSWKPAEQDSYESLVSFVKEMFDTPTTKITINKNRTQFLEDLKTLDKVVENENKLQLLSKLINNLQLDIKDSRKLNSESDDKKQLLFLISSAIVQLRGLEQTVEGDVKNFNDIINENLMTYIPERIQHKLTRQAINLTNTALNDARHKFNKDAEVLGPLHNEFYKGMNATDYKVKVIGDNYEYFQNLLEKDNGRYTWRFKNPETDPELSRVEKDYIKGYLKQINTIRRNKLIDKYGEGSEQIVQFDLNPPLEIPLMKAHGYSALKNKGIKAYAKDYWASLSNDAMILGNDVESTNKLNFQTQMFNQFDRFDMNADARRDFLVTANDNDLEQDLENIIYSYTMANAKQVVFDKALPTLNALKSIAMLSNNFYFKDLTNVEAFVDRYIGTTLFGKKILAGENAELSKYTKIAAGLTSKLTLGLSLPSALNETFNNAFMSISKVFGASVGKSHFSKDSWLGAEALVWSDKLGRNQHHIGKMNFTRQLNSMYSIVESDLGQLTHANQSTSTGLQRNFMSNVTMKLNQLPNFAHRMSFFVAQMIDDGVIKQSNGSFSKDSAMKMVGETLVYDPKLDQRFSLYLSSPNNFPLGKEESWKESRARYLKLEELLKQEENGINEQTGLINRPYENKTRDSLKSMADEVFGGYDPESKVMWANTAFGQLFNQFKNWMWSKKHRIWSPTDIEGRQGTWTYDKDQEDVIWKNDIMEGMGNSLWALFQQVKESRDLIGSWNELAPERKERILWGLSDLVLYALISGLAAFLLNEFNSDDYPIANTFAKSMRNSTGDLAFWSVATTVITPNNQIPMAGMINRVVQGTAGLITNDHQATQQMMNSLGLYRTLNPIYKQVVDKTE